MRLQSTLTALGRPALIAQRWLACCSLLVLALSGGCAGGIFSASKGPSREEELVKTLNEERKRAQYYQQQYEQAIARLDGEAPAVSRRNSSAFTSRDLNDRFISAEPVSTSAPSKGSSSKTLLRLASTLPGLRVGPDQTWAKLDTDLLFGGGSDELSSGASALLTDLAKTLTQESARDLRVLVVGYSDTQRTDESEPPGKGEDVTWKIAADRAVNVVRKLTQCGVAPATTRPPPARRIAA
jgi:flagellar motor protein MotB